MRLNKTFVRDISSSVSHNTHIAIDRGKANQIAKSLNLYQDQV